jgi:hypothetical protein
LTGSVPEPAVAGDPPIVVTNTNDSGPGSLRAAILSAFGGAQIHFSIPLNDPGCDNALPCAIRPVTPLPPLDDNNVVLDGYTQPGSEPNTGGVGDGSNAEYGIGVIGNLITNDADGLVVTADGVTIRGLVVAAFTEDGFASGFSASNTRIEGSASIANGSDGVSVEGDFNTVGGTTAAARNLFAENQGNGIRLNGDNNAVQNNIIGLGSEGLFAVPNGTGIQVLGSDNTIGGSAAGRNVISGNTAAGIRVGSALEIQSQGFSTPVDNTISFNHIGTGPSG